MVSDKEILDIYMLGFNDELDLDSLKDKVFETEIENNAYKLGRLDAIVGDDVPSIDNQTEDEILINIYNYGKRI